LRNWNWLNVDCLGEILKVKYVGGFTADFGSGLENVIFLWQSRISGEKKHLVLLISQKDYEHIKKYEVWDRD